jgi:methionine-gamma-lyase
MAPSESDVSPRRFRPLPEWARGPATVALHGARRPERNAGAVVPPIYQTSTFRYPGTYSELGAGGPPYLYTRYENPTQEVAAELVRALEGGGSARVYASGMGAIASVLLGLLAPGDELVALEQLYGGTLGLCSGLLEKFGVRTRWVSVESAAEPERLVGERTKVVFLESPTNPLLRIVDLERWAAAADTVGAISVVDNTMATPVNQRPIDLGIDVVVHSGSKYLGGHSDLIAGAVVAPAELMERLRPTDLGLGSVLDPFGAFLLARGIRTLEARMRRHNETAARVAAELESLPGVTRVWYPGSSGESEERLAARQMGGRSGVLAFSLEGGSAAAHRMLGRLELIQVASSFGAVESLVSLPEETSHVGLSREERAALGMPDGLVRLSVGLEDPDALVRDLREAIGGG